MSEPTRTPDPTDADATEALIAGSGSYELLRRRLAEQGSALLTRTRTLNEARLKAFGRSEQALVMRTRARTENNCIARDIVRIGDLLLFGYNVYIGLRKETSVGDVFSLYRLADHDGAEELEPVATAGSFLDDPRFVADFRELYTYYKQANLTQLRVHQQKLLAAFQIGQQLHDIRVFRWTVESDGSLRYLDNRGERDIALPPTHDFEWTATTREDHVGGKHPHVNILDTVFVETTGGDLTIKVENNTESGLGVYSEPVDDRNQSLADAEIAYARLGSLILLRIRPYREKTERYLVFNTRSQQAVRLDAIGRSCVQLPEDHGVIFPGGYYLQSGEHKRFDLPAEMRDGLRFKRMLRSPNGEDVLYVFYQPELGHYALFSYNLIEKTLATPIVCNGYARFDDGRMLVFQAEGPDATRNHPMQLWRTPFASDEHAAGLGTGQGFFGRIGNPELVRGIAELTAIARAVAEQTPTRNAYEALIRQCGRALDAYFWLGEAEAGALDADLRAIVDGARTTLDEFENVEGIRRDTRRALDDAEARQRELATSIASMLWQRPDDFVAALGLLREQRGRLQMLRELRYADLGRIDAMDATAAEEQQRVGERALRFLAEDGAFDSHRHDLERVAAHIPTAATSEQVAALLGELDAAAAGLDLLTEQIGGLPGGDAVVRTRILDGISAIYADINRLRAEARNRRRALGSTEAAAEFGAQFRLFGQAVENALELADTPEKCDDALTRLLAQLEELEGRFADQDTFLADIAAKRESVYEALSARRQALLDQRQRRAQGLADAAGRILDGVPRRVAQFTQVEQVHSYFAADALLAKLRQQIEDLRALGAGVLADDVDTRLRTARDQAIRAVRDRRELIADDGNTLRFGRHAFTVNRQPLDLTLVPRGGGLAYHLTGTDYFAAVADARLDALKPFWDQALSSESDALYRAEYLAGRLLDAVLDGSGPLGWEALQTLVTEAPDGEGQLLEHVRSFSAGRYQEGYQKGVHDHDAARILAALATMQATAGLLAFGPAARALALLYWHHDCLDAERDSLARRARAAAQMTQLFGARATLAQLEHECEASLHQFLSGSGRAFGFAVEAEGHAALATEAARYLVRQLAQPRGGQVWVVSGTGADLAEALQRELEQRGQFADWQRDLEAAAPVERWQLARDWVTAFAAEHGGGDTWCDDAAGVLAVAAERTRVNAELDRRVDGLLGEHPRIIDGAMTLNLNDFRARYLDHLGRVVPAFEALQALRLELVEGGKKRLRLDQFRAKPLSSFVRNRLIDEVYLPLIGNNLARQIGAAGDANRSDRSGLLLLISPPGYGKTTLMEYVADRLGMIFVRINCPALGHDVTATDPAGATHSAARQELEKLNLGLAMGNNVMLYLDDIQHTNPEFLQKFIALADGTRRIEAVRDDGQPFTADLRGKRFAIVMAGNPYTESGDVFKIPDMLANRSDIYNLGDVLSGREDLFALSYIENCLTANPVLLPLASRDPKDVHLLVRLAEGEDVATSAFSHGYSSAELGELSALLKRLFRARDLLLKVNLAYIDSAARHDAYRTEPPFKLQGSYRNMTKLATSITPLMRDNELDALLRDHYRGEAQTLTTGAEENLLKLSQLLDSMSPEEQARWNDICEEFVRRRKLGGDDADAGVRIAATLMEIVRAVEGLRAAPELDRSVRDGLAQLTEALHAIQPRVQVEAPDIDCLTNTLKEMYETYDRVLVPLVTATYRKMRLDHTMWEEMKRIGGLVERMEALSVPRASRSASAGQANGNMPQAPADTPPSPTTAPAPPAPEPPQTHARKRRERGEPER
ncbi:MAG: DNA repair ATPase [Rhodocyclaceae bacterium]